MRDDMNTKAERTEPVKDVERRRQYRERIEMELEHDRMLREAPKMFAALIEFRQTVREFRESGKLDYRKLGALADTADTIIAAADRRKEPRS
jgi:hypothetical protein